MEIARRPVRVLLLTVGSLATLFACERADDRVSRSDTTLAPPVSAVESRSADEAAQWESSAGSVLLVRDDSVARAVFPMIRELDSTAVLDEAIVRGFVADAVAPAGTAGSLRIRGFSPVEEECAVWPVVVLSADSTRDWTVAFQRGASTAIVLHAMEALASPDSARLAAELTRLAASLPNDTSRVFHGLPFVVRAAHLFEPAERGDAVVAEIARRVNVEANPREETLLLIAERDNAAAQWRVAYSERASGDEVRVERASPLAAVRLGAGKTPTVVLERAGVDWITYALVQRLPNGQWRKTWESAYSGC